jgi:hypothetical protein
MTENYPRPVMPFSEMDDGQKRVWITVAALVEVGYGESVSIGNDGRTWTADTAIPCEVIHKAGCLADLSLDRGADPPTFEKYHTPDTCWEHFQ